MTPIETIKNELDNHIKELDEYEHYRGDLTNYKDEEETPISDLIRNADFESIDFNIGFEQGYIRGLEVAISLLTNTTK